MGELLVTISGSGFTGATLVDFGAVPAVTFTVDSDSTISAVAPVGAAVDVNIRVTTPCCISCQLKVYVYQGNSFAYFNELVGTTPFDIAISRW